MKTKNSREQRFFAIDGPNGIVFVRTAANRKQFNRFLAIFTDYYPCDAYVCGEVLAPSFEVVLDCYVGELLRGWVHLDNLATEELVREYLDIFIEIVRSEQPENVDEYEARSRLQARVTKVREQVNKQLEMFE